MKDLEATDSEHFSLALKTKKHAKIRVKIQNIDNLKNHTKPEPADYNATVLTVLQNKQ